MRAAVLCCAVLCCAVLCCAVLCCGDIVPCAVGTLFPVQSWELYDIFIPLVSIK